MKYSCLKSTGRFWGLMAGLFMGTALVAASVTSAWAGMVDLVRLTGEMDEGKSVEYRLALMTDTQGSIESIELVQMIKGAPRAGVEPTQMEFARFLAPEVEPMLKMSAPVVGAVSVIWVKGDEGFFPDRGGKLNIRYLQNFFGDTDDDARADKRKYQNLAFSLLKFDGRWVLATDPDQDKAEKVERIVDLNQKRQVDSELARELNGLIPVRKIGFTPKRKFGKIRVGIERWDLLE